MPTTETQNPPVELMLDKRCEPKPNEQGILSWWITNTSGKVLNEVEVCSAEGHHANPGLNFIPKTDNRPWIDGQQRRLSTPLNALAAGQYAFRVRVKVRPQDAPPVTWESEDEISITVDNPDAGGRTVLHINASSVIKGELPPGEIHVNESSLLKFQSQRTPQAQGATLAGLPPEEHLLRLRLEPAPIPGLGANIGLEEFSRHWKDTDRPYLDAFGFIDSLGKPVQQAVNVGAAYQLQLKSHRAGHITLIAQGNSGRFFQLVPHVYYGQQMVRPHHNLSLTDMVKNYSIRVDGQVPDPEKQAALFTCSGSGTERALALVSQVPLRHEVGFFAGDCHPPCALDASEVRGLLQRALTLPDVELGYHALEVRG